MNLHDTTDAQVWAKEWLRIIAEHPTIPTDEGSMIGWFANAIMAGYDAASKGTNYQYTEYQVKMHSAHNFCQVHDCPYCLEISRSQRDNSEAWRLK